MSFWAAAPAAVVVLLTTGSGGAAPAAVVALLTTGSGGAAPAAVVALLTTGSGGGCPGCCCCAADHWVWGGCPGCCCCAADHWVWGGGCPGCCCCADHDVRGGGRGEDEQYGHYLNKSCDRLVSHPDPPQTGEGQLLSWLCCVSRPILALNFVQDAMHVTLEIGQVYRHETLQYIQQHKEFRPKKLLLTQHKEIATRPSPSWVGLGMR